MSKLKVFGLIPIKSQSIRFPNKNFSEFCSPRNGFRSTLISNTIDKLVKAKVDKIYISTDTPEKVKKTIVSPPLAFDQLYILKRLKELATSETPTNSVVQDFIKQLNIEDNYIIVLSQVTSPNWSSHRLIFALNKFNNKNKPVISVSPDFQPNGCFYIFTKESFSEHGSIHYNKNGIYLVVLPWNECVDIDHSYQLSISEAIEKGNYKR